MGWVVVGFRLKDPRVSLFWSLLLGAEGSVVSAFRVAGLVPKGLGFR